MEAAPLTGIVTAKTPPLTSGITQYSLPFKVPGSQEERKALHYFSNFAAADLTGYIPSTFWSRTVLQRCQHDVPIRHAAAALGRIHLEYITADDIFLPSEESVGAYRKSVKALRNYLGRHSTPDRSMVLICSAIFFCFELVRGDRRTAVRHLQSGLSILNEWQEDKSKTSTAADAQDQLVAVFGRLDLQATMFDDGRVPVLEVDDREPEGCTIPNDSVNLPYESLDEVQQCLFPLLHNAFSFLVRNVAYKFADIQAVPDSIVSQRAELVERFNVWEKRVHLLEHSKEREAVISTRYDSSDQRRALSASKLHHRTIKLLLLQCLQDEVKRYSPSFDDKADRLLEVARDVLPSDGELSDSPSSNASRRCFYLHLGVVAPIFLLAMKSNRSHVVRASIDLLRSASGRREGFYDAEQMAQVVESLAKMQEQSRAEDLYISVEERLLAGQPVTPSLEWLLDDVMQFKPPYHWHDEEGRWKGYDRLLALVA